MFKPWCERAVLLVCARFACSIVSRPAIADSTPEIELVFGGWGGTLG
jgi:hypothetical protein